MRKRLENGKGRYIIGVPLAGGSCVAAYLIWNALLDSGMNPLIGGQRLAFVAAAFSVTAYNLRTRVVDIALKLQGTLSRIRYVTNVARRCGRTLTKLILLFTAVAVILGAGGLIPEASVISRYYFSISFGLFIFSSIQFLFVLFAFDKLERFALESAEQAARDAAIAETK